MPRYTLCPYYIDESRKTISCEDVCRSFDSTDSKWAWTDMYCDSWDWMKCPYAMDRSEAYRRFEEGDTEALEEQKEKATKNEVRSLTTKLGRLSKKLSKLQAKNQDLEAQKKIYYDKWRAAEDQLREYERKIADQVMGIANAYEARLAYMMDMFSDGTLNESDVNEWLQGKEWAIVKNDYGFELVFKEEEETKDVKDNNVQDSENESKQA